MCLLTVFLADPQMSVLRGKPVEPWPCDAAGQRQVEQSKKPDTAALSTQPYWSVMGMETTNAIVNANEN